MKKRKMQIWAFDPVIYPYSLLLVRNHDPSVLEEMFNVFTVDDEEVEPTTSFRPVGDVSARMLSVIHKETRKMYYMILLVRPAGIGPGIITHESWHLANAYLQYIGTAPAKAYDDEPYAYMAQWVANCMWCTIIGEPEKMKQSQEWKYGPAETK